MALGMSLTASAENPCWSFGYATEGNLCWLIDEDVKDKILLGKVVFPKDKGKPAQCVYQNPVKEKSSSGKHFAFLLGDFEGLQRTTPGKDPVAATQFLNQFSFCHPGTKEAKAHPLVNVLKMQGVQDQICIKGPRAGSADEMDFGFLDGNNECSSIDVKYTKSDNSKKNEKYRKVCLYELLDQNGGWATDGPKGYKSHYGASRKNWYQGMHECQKQQLHYREQMPYCSWDQNGDFYYGRSQDSGDRGDGKNAVIRYRCLYELMDNN